ncbi:hypothetical protein Pelo_7335 [Pelomyxa schiedti]|nr:hypothetical protein Pelo_7335 [Pelomyxa schiedti]
MQYGLKKQEYALNKKLTGLRVRWKEPNLGPLERRSRVDQLTAPQSQELQRMKQDLQAKKRETKENVSRFHRIFKNDKKVLKGKIVDTNKGGTATTSAASGISPSTIQPTAPVYSI